MSSFIGAQQGGFLLPSNQTDYSDDFSDSDSDSNNHMDCTDDISDPGSESDSSTAHREPIFRDQDIETLIRNFPDQWNPRDIDGLFRGFVIFLESMNPYESRVTGFSKWLWISFSHHFRHARLCERFEVINRALLTIRDEYCPALRRLDKEYRLEREQYVIPWEGGIFETLPQDLVCKQKRIICIYGTMHRLTNMFCHYRNKLAEMIHDINYLIYKIDNEKNGDWDEVSIRALQKMEDNFSLHPEDCIEWDREGEATGEIHCQTCDETIETICRVSDKYGKKEAWKIIWGTWDNIFEDRADEEESNDQGSDNAGSNEKVCNLVNGPCECPHCDDSDEEMIDEEESDGEQDDSLSSVLSSVPSSYFGDSDEEMIDEEEFDEENFDKEESDGEESDEEESDEETSD